MFTSPRFVVLDDKERHLKAISRTINELGSSCASVLYSSESDPPIEPFATARAIFMDLQLVSQSVTQDFGIHFAEIQRILMRVIPPEGAAYLLILWTDRPDQARALELYLTQHLYPKAPHTRPIRLLALSKGEFIDLVDGEPVYPLQLKERILKDISSDPALAALFEWESDILKASNRVLADVVRIARRDPDDGPPELPAALKRLAVEAVGEQNVAADPQGAIHSALLPLLQDHAQQQAVVEDRDVINPWDRAFEGAPDPLGPLSLERAGALNSQLHLGNPSTTVQATTWGSVCLLEERLLWRREFGLGGSPDFIATMLDKLKGKKPGADSIRLAQIRVGAACDYAQRIDGPIPFVLAAFMPIADGHREPYRLGDGATAWISPILDVADWGIGHFIVDPRFVRIRGNGFVSKFEVVSRIREQLLMQLITSISQHGARPGAMQFIGKN